MFDFLKYKKKKQQNDRVSVVTTAGNNPYLNAKSEWLERYGSYIKQAQNWQRIALAMVVVTGISIFGNVYQALQSQVIPFVVEVDKLGRASVVGRLNKMVIPPERVIQSVISSVISDWRTVTVDIQVQRNMMKKLSFFFVGSAKGVIKEWYGETENNPYEIAKSGKLVSVEILSLPLKIEENAYRIEWRETTRNHSGRKLNETDYQATVTVALKPPMNEQILLYNPAGIYITSLNTSKVFNNEETK